MATNILGEHLEMQVRRAVAQLPRVKFWHRQVTTEYLSGRAIRQQRRQSVEANLESTWNRSSTSVLLDLYWGVDLPILWMGYVFSVDVTTNTYKLDDKLQLQQYNYKSEHCPHPHGVDRCAVWHCDSCPSPQWIAATLRAMTKQPANTVQVYRYISA
jgi:hypothetical protein